MRSLWLDHWEPGELRGSRRVLREAGGEVPPAYSPIESNGESGMDLSFTEVVFGGDGPDYVNLAALDKLPEVQSPSG